MAREKTCVVVFPPLTMPTSPPLGASMLKGYVERELPEWRIKVLDLNLWTFERLFEALAAGRIRLSPSVFPEGPEAAAGLVKAAAAFRGKNNHEFYDRPDLYERHGDLFLRFTEAYTSELGALCDSYRAGLPLPPVIQDFLNLIMAEKPDVVGISMIFSEQLPIGALLGKLIRKHTGVRVVFGGSCFADTAEHFLKWHPDAADVIIAGEGEEALKEYLANGTDLERVPGAVYYKDGTIHKVPKAFPKDIDHYGAPDFSDLDLKSYFSPEPVVPLLLSRGCYWRRCTFCVHYRSAGLTYRMHTMDFTIDMLRSFVAKGIRNFAFIDEMISPKHFTWLAEGIKEANLDISYYALTKPTKDFTPHHFSVMAASGCKYLLWGLESGNQRVLDLMDKGSKVAEVAQTLRNAHAAGIANHVFMICGFPTETEEEFADTIRFLDENKDYIYAIHRGTFSLEPESPIFEHQERFSITRSWLLRDTPSGGRWGYECSSGMTMERVREVFISSLPFLRVFNPYARVVANFRDHALLLYGKLGSRLRPEVRRFPEITYAPRGVARHGPAFQVRPVPGGRDDGKAEHLEDCKAGFVSAHAASGGSAGPTAAGLTAKQIADFFANEAKQKARMPF
jgi:anaerobic magnesium-protoporphyrin IX monomethyl ester cyclase